MNEVWIDLETTGTNEWAGSIVEVGLIVVVDGRQVQEAEWLVQPRPAHWEGLAPVVRAMHQRSGLFDALEKGPTWPVGTVDNQVAALLDPWTVDGQIILAGSGVGHFDGRWIRHHMPKTARRLTYWTHDVGVVRRFIRKVDPELVYPQRGKAHRALADARDHLVEWHFYQALLEGRLR